MNLIILKLEEQNENSYILWHKRLGYIFEKRIDMLLNDRILDTLDKTDNNISIGCTKGKTTNNRKVGG